ncbi:MAG: glycosyltransferase family 2 protein [Culicoidibacterales bacterium]
MNPQVSVIIAAYNIEKYIDKCIESIVNQTLRKIEVIVVNDGSTDSTLEIIKGKAGKDNRIKIVDKQNAGLIEARKSGLAVAKGEYLLFVDGDDWLELEALDVLYKKATSDNYDIVCYNAYWSFDDYKEKVRTFSDSCGKDYLENLFLSQIKPAIWAKFIKKSYIETNEIEFASHISYAEDLATVASLLMHNPKVGFEKANLYNYYQRENSISKTITPNILRDLEEAVRIIGMNLKKNKLYDIYENAYKYMIFEHMIYHTTIKLTNENKLDIIELYKKYEKEKFYKHKNRYIKAEFNKQPIAAKIRLYLYAHKYSYGRTFDKIRKIIKGEK